MPNCGVLVVGETPSLGQSIVDLLEAERLRTEYVLDVEERGPVGSLADRYSLIVVACNEHRCLTARRWKLGELPPDLPLLVVGSRDPVLATTRGVHQVPLPLEPDRFLSAVHSLLGRHDHRHHLSTPPA
jgi:hypothetical protein